MSSDAQRRATAKYNATQGRIAFYADPEIIDSIRIYAAGKGETLKGFILRACQEQMKRDRGE